MLVNFTEMLQKAKSNHYAVPHFDINNLEWVNENKKYSYIHEIVGLPNESTIIIDNNDSINYIGEYYVFCDGEIK